VQIHRFTISSGRFIDSPFHPAGRNRIRKLSPDKNQCNNIKSYG
jgi:hypothetical protein